MAQSFTLINTRDRSKLFTDTLQVIGGSLFIALCAQIAIPLPFTPIPITGQTFAVLLLGATMGSKKGFLCLLAYLTEICLGLPVLPAAAIAPWTLFGLKSGYYIGMAVQAYLAGLCMEHSRSRGSLLFGLIGACAVQLAFGSWILSSFVGGFANAMVMGFLPFIPGEILKSIAVASYVSKRK